MLLRPSPLAALISFLILTVISPQIYSQVSNSTVSHNKNPYLYTCEQQTLSTPVFQPGNLGFIKPSITDLNTPQDAYFPVLIVFVQFANDPGPDCDWWPKGSPPEYMNQLIAPNKKYPVNGNWWDTYSEENELISDYWLEQSRGNFHIVGKAVSIILDHDYLYYQSNGGVEKVNDDIYKKLNGLGTIDWREFDKWKSEVKPGLMEISYQPDGYVDMIYKIFRSHAPKLGMPAGGIAQLGLSYLEGMNYMIDSTHNIYINGDYYFLGSGLSMSPGFGGDEYGPDYTPYAPLTKTGVASFTEHEHGHYLFGPGHSNYGKMSGAGAPYGVDECLSPWENIAIGYMIPKKVNYGAANYVIGDFSSRTSGDTGEVLQVPISINNEDEFFLIANRTKVSDYDKIMWGDTAHGDPYRNINPNYGKGVYIYHCASNYVYPSLIDQECADGLFKWTFGGYAHPDWSNTQEVGFYIKQNVSYDNDCSMGLTDCADGKSMMTWFSYGKHNDNIYCDGTDKIFTNQSDLWTSRELQGDRWDAWNVGYNEMFSPYSSPSTKDWQNGNSGIYIWYYADDTLTHAAKFKIFRTGFGGMTEDDILAVTPPSKPMGLTLNRTGCTNGHQYPLLTWNQNMEPDMLNSESPLNIKHVKKYNIYRARAKGGLDIPVNYELLESVYIMADSIPNYADYSLPLDCSGRGSANETYRYKITAVDNRGTESVQSDFVSLNIIETFIQGINQNGSIPHSYELKQNYPNPFNPATLITFSLPKEGNVKLTVFNLLGEQIGRLVNEYKKEGTYSVKFDGSNLASGIYFYKLETSSYNMTRRMVLLK